MANKDFYQVLGIPKTATEAEIKSAYRKSARAHHPDVDKSPGASEKFKEISEAYQILSDPQKRKTYDQFGSAAFDSGAGGGNPFAGGGNPFGGGFSYSTGGFSSNMEDPFELFNTIFSQSGFGSVFNRRPTFQLNIKFDEAINGTTKEVEITDQRGQRKKMTIKVPAGVDNGTRIRFGEIEIVFQVDRHPEFLREGPDIFSESKLSVPQMVLGVVINVKTVNGQVKVKVPNGTQPGSLVRIKGKGVQKLTGSGKGDHYVRVLIDIPKKLSNDEKKLYEQLENLGTAKKGWFN